MRHVPYFLGLSLGFSVLGGLGCSSSSTATTTITRPELVAVSPDDFLDTLVCGAEPGQVQSYVATLFDVTPAADGGVPDPAFQLPSSPPTSCLSPVTFSLVVTGHRYIAQVDAYDHPPSSLLADAGAAATPISPTAPGSRLMQAPNNARVTPHWTFTCGGYAPARVDGGANTYGGAGSVSEGEAGEAGTANPLVGVRTYDGLTQTVHDCRAGLQMIAQ